MCPEVNGNLSLLASSTSLAPATYEKRPFPAAGNDFPQVWTNLCYRECFCKTICWQDLHFEFYRQILNRKVQSPPMW